MTRHLKNSAEILESNRMVHQEESVVFDRIHPELTSRVQVGRDKEAIGLMKNALGLDEIRVLDMAAGTGNLSLLFLEQGCRVDALDISQEMTAIFQTKLMNHPAKAHCVIHCEDADAFLSRNKSNFHIIAVRAALHHFPDYLETLRIAVDALSPNGFLYISHEPAPIQSRFQRARILFASKLDAAIFRARLWLQWRLVPPRLDYSGSDPHASTGLDLERIVNLLKEKGLKQELVEWYGPWKTALVNSMDVYILRTKHQFRLIARRQS